MGPNGPVALCGDTSGLGCTTLTVLAVELVVVFSKEFSAVNPGTLMLFITHIPFDQFINGYPERVRTEPAIAKTYRG